LRFVFHQAEEFNYSIDENNIKVEWRDWFSGWLPSFSRRLFWPKPYGIHL